MKYLLSITLCVSLMVSALAQNKTKPDPNFHIYLLLGQSNMAGRGEITGAFINEGNPRVMMLNKENQWVLAKHPLHFDKPKAAGVGPGLAFGIKMAEANPNVQIGLVPCAVGGTSISKWEPGKYDKETDTHPYDDAVARIEEAMKKGVIKGLLWHQGESDTNPEKAANYLSDLKTLIERIRKVCKNPDLPVVVGELGLFKENRKIINEVIAPLPSQVPHTAIAKSNGLEQKGDGAHFNSESAQILGYRFAEQMLILQKNK
ncbi:MAG: sialate O-acetylesterase [Chitinophagaceae bacterium]